MLPQFPAKSWRRLRNILGRLPTTSAFVKAQRLDPEVADEAVAEQQARKERDQPQRQWRPDLAEWGPTEELLATLTDRMGELETLIANLPAAMQGKKGKAKPPPPYPRPKTAMDEADKRRRLKYFEELDADVREAQERWRQQQAGAAS
jgi:hypothetical protein